MTQRFVRCKGCGQGSRALQFYDVANDELFHDQVCADAYWGIIRGKNGFVVAETKRYKCKQNFKDEKYDS